jgi:hypothetical protein
MATSEVLLDKFEYDRTGSAGSVVVQATRGRLQFVTGSQDQRAYLVNTPYGSLGVSESLASCGDGPMMVPASSKIIQSWFPMSSGWMGNIGILGSARAIVVPIGLTTTGQISRHTRGSFQRRRKLSASVAKITQELQNRKRMVAPDASKQQTPPHSEQGAGADARQGHRRPLRVAFLRDFCSERKEFRWLKK